MLLRITGGRGHGRRGVSRSSHVTEAVLQKADLNASATSAVHFAIFRLDWGIAHTYGINPVDWHIVVEHQITDHHLRHFA